VLALGKVEGGAIGLIYSPVGLFWITTLKLIEEDPVEVAFFVIWLGEVKLRACQHKQGFWLPAFKQLTKSSTISEIHSPSRWKTKP
jgi:hypothetical protein